MSDSGMVSKGGRGTSASGQAIMGRKRKIDLYGTPIRNAEKKIADHLPEIVDKLLELANGEYIETKVKMEPAGTLFRDDYESYEIDIRGVKQLRYKRIKVPMYPNVAPDLMVVTEETKTTYAPDAKSCMYLLNRIMGTPQALSEEELSTARAILAGQQATANVFLAQALFLEAQREAKIKETALVEAQFVTEEEERARMQRLAESINRPLLHMTPEIAASFGITDPDKLEDLKAYLGRGQQEVLREVFSEEDPNRIIHEDEGGTQAEEVWEEESE